MRWAWTSSSAASWTCSSSPSASSTRAPPRPSSTAVAHNVGLVARGVFGQGFLPGTLKHDAPFAKDDRRSWQAPEDKRTLAAKADALRALTGPDRSLAQLCVQYVL